jgi:hypothetical protein
MNLQNSNKCICGKDFSKLNDYNIKHHKEHCSAIKSAKNHKPLNNIFSKLTQSFSSKTTTPQKTQAVNKIVDEIIIESDVNIALEIEKNLILTSKSSSENNTDNNTSADEDEFSSDSDTLKKTEHATVTNKPQSQKKSVKRTRHETTINTTFNSSLNSFTKCKGYNTGHNIEIFKLFPFQLLNQFEVVFENQGFHSKACHANNYICQNETGVNVECQQLWKIENFKKTLDSAKMIPNIYTNHKFLNFNQLKYRLDSLISEKNDLKLIHLNQARKIHCYENKTNLYSRMVNIISRGEINRLNQLFTVSINNGNGLQSILKKLEMAYNGTYKHKGFTDKEKDFGYLIVKTAGSRVAELLSNDNKIGSSDYLNKCLKDQTIIEYSSSTSKTAQDTINANIKMFFNDCSGFFSIKMDEIALKPSIRYNPKNNEIIGFCQHCKFNTTFSHEYIAEKLKKSFENHEIHLANEALLITISKLK